MKKETTQKYRISITPTTMEDLEQLRYAFEGKMAHGEHQECSDDVLVAALLGWHFRHFGEHSDWFAKPLLHEFNIRQHLASGSSDSSLDEKYRARRSHFRGSPSTPGNILTLDGIDTRTVRRIEIRAQAVKMMVNKLNENHGKGAAQRLERYSDQAIIDLGIWWTLTNDISGNSDHIEPFPYWVKDEIMARAYARTLYENREAEFESVDTYNHGCDVISTLIENVDQETKEQSDSELALPPLSMHARLSFYRHRGISRSNTFWTDERIRAAMEMGL